jgi:ATPase subunit of ABC transporter with duplicated ATPase domains
MSRVVIQNLGVSYGEYLFRDLSFAFGKGVHVGVVGNNGAGKSTLLKCIAGIVEPTVGSVAVPRPWRVEYVEQDVPERLLDMTLHEVATSSLSDDLKDTYAWRADIVLADFGATDDILDRPVAELSGGWQRLAMLARAWVADPDLLVLDEPTNHLDLAKIVMLETWFKEHLGDTSVVTVSHDRRFLDRCTNSTLFVRPQESRFYDKAYSRARHLLSEDDRAIEARQGRDMKEIERLQKSSHDLRQIGVNKHSENALRKSIQLAKRAQAIMDAMPQGHVERRRDIRLAHRDTHAKRLIAFKDTRIVSPTGQKLFQISNLEVNQGDRVVLLGRNGTGKSCFVRMLHSAFLSPNGQQQVGIQIAPSVKLGYIDQHMSQLPGEETLRDFINHEFETGAQRATSVLAQSGFPFERQSDRISALSPGETSRLAFLILRLRQPNFYLMDEPTNNLDIAGQESLESEIVDGDATAVVVSHDRAFVENVGTRFLVIEGARLLEIERPDPFYRSLSGAVLASKIAGKVIAR